MLGATASDQREFASNSHFLLKILATFAQQLLLKRTFAQQLCPFQNTMRTSSTKSPIPAIRWMK